MTKSTELTLNKVGAVKLDQGYKSVLRPFRKAFMKDFSKTGKLYKGRHHWTEDKWFLRVESYLQDYLELHDVTEYEIAAAILLLYPAFGPSTGKEPCKNDKNKASKKKEVD